MSKILILIFLVSNALLAQIQVFKRTDLLKFSEGTNNLQHALNGGFNSIQASTIDLDHDGIEDLFLFDRSSKLISVYLIKNVSGTIEYHFSADYQHFFPSMQGWVLLRDYNCDGKKDIFTNTPEGIKIYKNITQSGALPQFELVVDGLKTKGFNFMINLQVSIADIPSISDIDGDGDLDIAIFDWVGGSFIEYHKNFSVETYGICDSLKYERVSNCWGHFSENSTCNDYSFGISCKNSGGGDIDSNTFKTNHVGSTLLVSDLNGDAIGDIILGDVSCYNLVKLLNVGTNDDGLFTSFETNYPPSRAVNTLYPAAFIEDIDANGKPDLVVSTNIEFNTGRDTDFHQSMWYYKNISTTNTPNFDFVKKDLFQSSGIDLGERSHPLFWDIDADGDQDLLISSFGMLESSTVFRAKVYLYENIGNNQYKLIDTDYLGFSQYNYVNLKLAKGDLNGDGAPDLLFSFSENNISTPNPRINIAYNQAQANDPIAINVASAISSGINSGSSDAPFLVDLDNDNDLDLLIGTSAGQLRYFNNTGSTSNFNFTLVTDTLLGIKNSSRKRSSVPFVADIDSNNIPDLVIGDNSGYIKFYMNFGTNLNTRMDSSFAVIAKNQLSNSMYQPFLGNYLSPYMFDFDYDNQLDLFAGTNGGGIIAFRNITNDPNSVAHQVNLNNSSIAIYPNPASDILHLELEEFSTISIFDLKSKLLHQSSFKGVASIDLAALSNGVYMVKIESDNLVRTQKLSIVK